MSDDAEVVARLRKHYKENVLEPKPNPKCEEVKRLLENPETFEKVVAEGLNRKYDNLEIIRESDTEGSRLIKLDSTLSMVGIEMPHEKFASTEEKLGSIKTAVGTAYARGRFDEDSLFHEMNVIIFDRDYADTLEHEESHVKYNEFSRPRQEISIARRRTPSKDEKKYFKLLYQEQETRVLKEILALTPHELEKIGSDSDWADWTSRCFKAYAAQYAASIAGRLDKAGLLQRYWGNDIPSQKAKEMVKKEAGKYFERRFDEGFKAIKTLYEKMPLEGLTQINDVITRIVASCGPTREEIECGNYVGPVKELAEWAENGNYKKVLASIIPENVKWVIGVPHNPAGT